MEYKWGVISGRFQPFHNGHLNYFEQSKQICECVIVGITNPSPDLTRHDSFNEARSQASNNPFSYFERYLIIRSALENHGYTGTEFHIVPFPINFPPMLRYFAPTTAMQFVISFDRWGERKKELLIEAGYDVHVLPTPILDVTATLVRERMLLGNDWESLVPKGAAQIIKDLNLHSRISDMLYDS